MSSNEIQCNLGEFCKGNDMLHIILISSTIHSINRIELDFFDLEINHS